MKNEDVIYLSQHISIIENAGDLKFNWAIYRIKGKLMQCTSHLREFINEKIPEVLKDLEKEFIAWRKSNPKKQNQDWERWEMYETAASEFEKEITNPILKEDAEFELREIPLSKDTIKSLRTLKMNSTHFKVLELLIGEHQLNKIIEDGKN